jgi:hypothetical protein
MLELYQSILGMFLAAVTIIGIVWTAIRYMIKYKIERVHHDVHQHKASIEDHIDKKHSALYYELLSKHDDHRDEIAEHIAAHQDEVDERMAVVESSTEILDKRVSAVEMRVDDLENARRNESKEQGK